MATRYAVATGNWSNTATWDGGTLPTAADDVHANNRTVTIDQNVTVLSLRTTAGGAAVAGGGFSIPSGSSYNVTATNGFIAGSSAVLTITGTGTRVITGNATGSATTATVNTIYVTHSSGNIPNVTINGNLLGGSQGNSVALYIWGGYVTVNGSVTGGTASTNTHGIGIFNSDNQPTQLTVNTGPVTGGSSSSGSTVGVSVGYSPTGSALTNSFINLNCNLVGGSNNSSNTSVSSGQNIPITVVGNIVGTVANGLSISGSAITTYNITGNIGASGATNYCLISQNVNATFNVTGNVFGSDVSGSGSGVRESPGTFIINGNVTAGRLGHAIDKNSFGPVTVNGNVFGWPGTGGLGGGGSGILCQSGSSNTITINGNATGGMYPASNSRAIVIQNAVIATVNGSAIGGSGNLCPAILMGGNNASLTVTRAVGSNGGFGAPGVGSTVFVNPGVDNVISNINYASPVYYKELQFGAFGAFPIAGHARLLDQTSNVFVGRTSTNTDKTLTDPNATGTYPTPANVRSGVSYASGNFTGTLAVPAASSVAAGVAVDNTVGIAVLTQANVWDYALSSASSTPGSVGEKLKKTAIPADIIALG
jgi:hypothetical protein